MEEFKLGIINDRRLQPTPILSRYTSLGPKKRFNGFTERALCGSLWSGIIIFFAFDGRSELSRCLFYLMILENGGQELNPIVGAAIDLLGEKFWIWKYRNRFLLFYYPLPTQPRYKD